MRKLLPFVTSVLIFINLIGVQAQNPPVAVNDTATVVIFDSIAINVIANDYDPDGDSIYLGSIAFGSGVNQGILTKSGNTIKYKPSEWANGWVRIRYYVKDYPSGDLGLGFLDVKVSNYGSDTLNVNYVGAKINAGGTLFYAEGTPAYYNVPQNSAVGSVFSTNLWFAGEDQNGQLHLIGDIYDHGDYQAGPIADAYSDEYHQNWFKVWKLERAQVQYHINNWNQTGYIPSSEITSWPGNGDTTIGQTALIAPFKDLNNDGIYSPLQGDYPLIPGDQAVFFVYNDDCAPPAGLNAMNMKFEIRGMAYAFNCEDDSALMYTTFYHYDIVNRSTTNYPNCSMGVFVEFDLGNAWDDYIGSDVKRASFYAYNGKNVDGTTSLNGYGPHPPVQAMTILGGPLMDPDGFDNPAYDSTSLNNCGYAVNGSNFGDNIVDNERFGLTGFHSLEYAPMTSPSDSNFLSALGMGWPDGSHVSYGGAGHPAFGATGPDCSFMYPYNSDPCNWGTAGIQPTGFSTGAGGSGPFWTEAQAGNVPYDVRGLGLCGSFSMAPGEVKTLDMALVFGRNYIDTNAFAGLSVVNQRIDQIRNYYNQNTTPCGNWYVGLDDNAPKPDRGIRVFPNPARNSVNIECTNIGKNQDFSIFNLIGLEVRKGILLDNTVNLLNISDLKPGVYFLRIRNETVKKFVINR